MPRVQTVSVLFKLFNTQKDILSSICLFRNKKVCHFRVIYYSKKTDLLKMQIIDVFFRTTITQIILEFFWKDQNVYLQKIQILMEGFSFWIKIEGVRLELNDKNSIYRSRKTVCLFTINCDCISNQLAWVHIFVTAMSQKCDI